MVCPLSIRGNGDGDAENAEEHEDQRPPGEVGEAAADGGYYGADESDDPRELDTRLAGQSARPRRQRVLTTPMEMVARAKGSPMMRPMLKVARWP